MNAPLATPWTQEDFFAWASAQDSRYEFDGTQPVAMTGGTVNHSIITQNVHAALRARLRGTACRPLGPDVGVATIADAVRYPDAVVTCTRLAGDSRVVSGVVVVLEVVSPSSGRTDRIVKVREYAAVPSILRYVIFESTSIGLQIFERASPTELWKAFTLTAEDTLHMPEIGSEVPVTDFYEDVDFVSAADGRE